MLSCPCLGQRREGESILLGSIGSTPENELLSPIPALASDAALKDIATHNAGSHLFARDKEIIPLFSSAA